MENMVNPANPQQTHANKNCTLAAKDPKQRGLRGSLGAYCLGACSPGAYSLPLHRFWTSAPTHALTHSLGAYSLGAYSLEDLAPPISDLGT